jgi:hypothetical protein
VARFSSRRLPKSAKEGPESSGLIYNRGPLGVQFGKPVKSVLESPRLMPRLTRNQVLGFWAAWGGWTMDGMDSFIYSLVLVPALREVLPRSGIPATTANIGYCGGLLFALFMIGWGMALVELPLLDRVANWIVGGIRLCAGGDDLYRG